MLESPTMANISGKGELQEIVWEAKVIRANGSVEDLGVIAYYHKNPVKRCAYNLKKWLRLS
jgi:hypothetical protein